MRGMPQMLRLDRDGGLLGHLTVWQNLLLPLEYHGRDTAQAMEEAALLYALCGEDEKKLPQFLGSYPDALGSYEKRLAGFMRAMLLEPDSLALDDVCDGLGDREREKAMRWEQVFRLRFPFRAVLKE